RATVELRGSVKAGEIWTIRLTETDPTSLNHTGRLPQSFAVVATGADTLQSLAAALGAQIDATANYIARVNGSVITITAVPVGTAPARAFFTEIQIGRGGAIITATRNTNGEMTGAVVQLAGQTLARLPAPEIWKLTLNGQDV